MTSSNAIVPRVRHIIDLENSALWPADVIDYLERHHDFLLAWEQKSDGDYQSDEEVRAAARTYDQIIEAFCAILNQYFLTGWHCTRLTDAEIGSIISSGMRPPNLDWLQQRINAIEAEGIISSEIAERLRSENQAHESNRANRIWFCFFPPYIAGESGIERFFRCWGGEALYNTHEDDPETGAYLRAVGTPCLIEADVPIASLKGGSAGLAFKIVRRFLISRGFITTEPVDHEDRAGLAISPEYVRRIIKFPEDDFVRLTKCDGWRTSL